MAKIIHYEHHGTRVSVDKDLKGKHREHCLCFRCKRFNPGRPPEDISNPDTPDRHCSIANLIFALDCAAGLVTPVYECPVFEERKP